MWKRREIIKASRSEHAIIRVHLRLCYVISMSHLRKTVGSRALHIYNLNIPAALKLPRANISQEDWREARGELVETEK